MKIHASLPAALIGAGLLAALPLAAGAHQSTDASNTRATTYLNGGIGKGDEAHMRRVAGKFPLRMTFSEHKDGELLAGVPVVITNARGTPVFELSKAGPMLDVMLPDGTYKVSARHRGVTESQYATLDGKAGKDLYFHWTGKPTA